MHFQRSKKIISVVLPLFALGVSLQAATSTLIVESNQVMLEDGTAVGYGDVNAFYGISTSTIEELNTVFDSLVQDAINTGNLEPLIDQLSSISWTPVPQATELGEGYEWATSFLDPIDVSVGDRVLVAFVTSDMPGSIVLGDQIGIGASPYTPVIDADAYTTGFVPSFPAAYQMDVIVGTEGSITMTAVPEPSSIALVFGIFGIGFAVWRRRN